MAGPVFARMSARRIVVSVLCVFCMAAAAVVVAGIGSRAQASVTVRGVYGADSSGSGSDVIRGSGFNTVTSMPYRDQLDRLNALGMKAVVWLWGYTKDGCHFWHSDDQIRAEVSAIAGHPAIAAYQVDDEPNYARVEGCPQVVDQMRARVALVRSLDPTKPTYLTISTWDGKEGFPYQYFAGVTDIMGLVVYPYGVNASQPYNIDTAIAQADADGVPRYWAVMQTYGDTWYRMPSQSELQDQVARWSRSRMEGYFIYNFNQQASWMVDWCEKYAYCLDAFKAFNGSTSTSPTTSPTPTASPTPAASPTPTGSPTPAPPADTSAPTAPAGLTARWEKRTVVVSWLASTDNVGVAGYRIYRDGALIASTRLLLYTDRPAVRLSHRYEVRAYDAAGNVSAAASGFLGSLR